MSPSSSVARAASRRPLPLELVIVLGCAGGLETTLPLELVIVLGCAGGLETTLPLELVIVLGCAGGLETTLPLELVVTELSAIARLSFGGRRRRSDDHCCLEHGCRHRRTDDIPPRWSAESVELDVAGTKQ